MPYARRLQLERADDAARLASLGGLALALAGALRLVPPGRRVADLVLSTDSKPQFASSVPAYSISHTPTRVGCALAVGSDLGLDLESMPARVDAGGMARLRRWTAVEATLKAAGCGVRRARDVELDVTLSTSMLAEQRYRLREVHVAADTLGHLATVDGVELETSELELDAREVSIAVERALGFAPEGA